MSVITPRKMLFFPHGCADFRLTVSGSLPQAGGLVTGNRLKFVPGGNAVAAALAAKQHLGQAAEVCFAGAIGEGPIGSMLVQSLESAGVNASYVTRRGSDSGSLIILDSSSGERTILHDVGANREFSAEMLEPGVLAAMDYVHAAGIGLMPGLSAPELADRLAGLPVADKLLSLDTVNPGHSNREASFHLIEPLLPLMDIVFMSIAESVPFTGLSTPVDVANFLVEHGARIAVVKAGTYGVWYRIEGSRVEHVAAYRAEARDTCGAGDGFCAYFLAYLSQHLQDLTALRFVVRQAVHHAAAAAALQVASGRGVFGAPTFAEAESFAAI